MTRKELIERYESGERDFSGANLCEANLRWANLSGANLCGADLRWADLCEADLRVANLCEANLSWANLSGANLRRANLRVANLCEANLSWANLSGANLRRANLRGADLRWAIGKKIYQLKLSKHQIIAVDKQIQIGCQIMPSSEWVETFEKIGHENKYTPEEIAEYGLWIRFLHEVMGK